MAFPGATKRSGSLGTILYSNLLNSGCASQSQKSCGLANAITSVGTISDIGLRLLPNLSVSFIIPYGFSYHWLQCMMHLVLLGTVGTFVLFEMGILNWLIYLVGKSLAMFVEGFDSISLWLILTFILKGYYCCLL